MHPFIVALFRRQAQENLLQLLLQRRHMLLDSQGDGLLEHAFAKARLETIFGNQIYPAAEQLLQVLQQPSEIEQRTPAPGLINKSTSLSSVLSPRATEPNTRTSPAR
jgi:hypothetical protein